MGNMISQTHHVESYAYSPKNIRKRCPEKAGTRTTPIPQTEFVSGSVATLATQKLRCGTSAWEPHGSPVIGHPLGNVDFGIFGVTPPMIPHAFSDEPTCEMCDLSQEHLGMKYLSK